ncbi:hypothetical protein [Shewanella kaireitica]|uniref:hypothetical protein n=1 Tax=Shewanella kaireitica TaxID=212021 RepID=UPI00200C6C39|nr:hypothetical protein [Shewanella kaireitica]MCL1093456.1 hypothetical protein [Shewanella kaireitica]
MISPIGMGGISPLLFFLFFATSTYAENLFSDIELEGLEYQFEIDEITEGSNIIVGGYFDPPTNYSNCNSKFKVCHEYIDKVISLSETKATKLIIGLEWGNSFSGDVLLAGVGSEYIAIRNDDMMFDSYTSHYAMLLADGNGSSGVMLAGSYEWFNEQASYGDIYHMQAASLKHSSSLTIEYGYKQFISSSFSLSLRGYSKFIMREHSIVSNLGAINSHKINEVGNANLHGVGFQMEYLLTPHWDIFVSIAKDYNSNYSFQETTAAFRFVYLH